MEFKYPLFDGEKLWEGAAVTVEGGVITSVTACDKEECKEGLLMPGLIDAHTHMGAMWQVREMLKAGITATCDVSASAELVHESKEFSIISSRGMAMGIVMNSKGFVERCIENNAGYIKVLLFSPLLIGKAALSRIVKYAHEKGLKVAVHATEVATYRQAVEAGADILLHVPMKEAFPEKLAGEIAQKGISVAPTLVMMEAFAHSGRNGYLPEYYVNAENVVKLLRQYGVRILAATDANEGGFAPKVEYGVSLHREMELLKKAGLSKVEVFAAVTSSVADAFKLEDRGRIEVGKRADILLLDNRFKDGLFVRKLWVKGEEV